MPDVEPSGVIPTARATARPDHGGDPIGEPDDRQRHQPQHRRSVGDDQQQRHHRRGDGEQRDVGSGERVRDVGAERGAAGDLRPQIVGQSFGGRLAKRLDRIVEGEPGEIGVQRHHRERRLDRRRTPVPATVCSMAARSAGFSARAVVAGDDDDRGDVVTAGELGPQMRRRAPTRRCAGTGTGDRWLESSPPISPISAPETATTTSASTHGHASRHTPNISDT